jgi:hypothetical protein
VKPGRIMFELAGVSRGAGPGRHGARHPEAADQGQVHHPSRRGGDLTCRPPHPPRSSAASATPSC